MTNQLQSAHPDTPLVSVNQIIDVTHKWNNLILTEYDGSREVCVNIYVCDWGLLAVYLKNIYGGYKSRMPCGTIVWLIMAVFPCCWYAVVSSVLVLNACPGLNKWTNAISCASILLIALHI